MTTKKKSITIREGKDMPPMDKAALKDNIKRMKDIAARKQAGFFIVVDVKYDDKGDSISNGCAFANDARKSDIISVLCKSIGVSAQEILIHLLHP